MYFSIGNIVCFVLRNRPIFRLNEKFSTKKQIFVVNKMGIELTLKSSGRIGNIVRKYHKVMKALVGFSS